jgi:transcription initiation factor TFIIH subunit 4
MDFSAYLMTLPQEQLQRLYDSPWTCQAVLRSLPPLPQHFVLRMLFMPGPVPASWLDTAVQEHKQRERDAGLDLLARLHVLRRGRDASGSTWALDATFQQRLQYSVLNPVSLGQQSAPVATAARGDGGRLASVADVNAFGDAQWQAVLLALVDGRRASLRVHKDLKPLDVRQLFHSSGLTDDATELTDAGFKFLFLDVYSQLWQLLQRYLQHSAAGHSLADALSFLLQLSFRKARPLCIARAALHVCRLGKTSLHATSWAA